MKAHELLSDESKWCKGSYRNGDKVCITQAVLDCYDNPCPSLLLISKEIGFTALILWNDAPERTFAEVKELLVRLDI